MNEDENELAGKIEAKTINRKIMMDSMRPPKKSNAVALRGLNNIQYISLQNRFKGEMELRESYRMKDAISVQNTIPAGSSGKALFPSRTPRA